MSTSGTDVVRILLVDDEELVRRALSRTLTRKGFIIEEAGDGLDAVEKILNSSDTIHLVICDGSMPRMDGPDAFEAVLQALSPDKMLPWLYVSAEGPGSPLRARMDAHAASYASVEFAEKPFPWDDLLGRIARLTGR